MIWSYIFVGAMAAFVLLAMWVDFSAKTEFSCFYDATCDLCGYGFISLGEAERRIAERTEEMDADGRWPPPTRLRELRSKQ